MWILGFLLLILSSFAGVARGQGLDDARRCSEENDPDLRIEYCTRAIQSRQLTGSRLAVTFKNRGNAYARKAQYDRAIQDYDQALRLKPDFHEALNNRGLAYGAKAQYDRAIQDYDQALRLKLDVPEAFDNRGRAYARKAQYDRAIQDYDQALRLKPDDLRPYLLRGYAHFHQGRFDAAASDLAVAQRVSDDARPVLWLYLARSRSGRSAREDLAGGAQKLRLSKWPGPVVAMYLGRATPAATLAAAKHSDPKTQREQECEAYFYIGQYHLLQGNKAEATRMFRAAVATGVTGFWEYTAAKAELSRLGN